MNDNNRLRLLLIIRCLIIVLVIILCFLFYVRFNVNDLKPKFYLLGDDEITLEVGEKYKEPGYVATFNNKDYKNTVSVISNLNIDKIGKYSISYTMYMKYLKLGKTIQRKINVVDTTPPELSVDLDDTIYLKKHENFAPTLAKANDNYDGDITSKVNIQSNVNTNETGEYYIKYSVEDSSHNKTEKEIKVNVQSKNAYIDVSITNQQLNYYEYGQVVFTSDVVTGINNGTPVGDYKILYKTTDTDLKGKDYTSHVYYWMAFLGGSYGIHDATWRSSFGGSIYKYNGSHGCVNMPYSKISSLYYMVDVGTPVYIHY